ncbi:MAG: SCP-like extracellular [Ruminococcus sp.]|nr:SCP-like extracellular [Ruminococcus sp.]
MKDSSLKKCIHSVISIFSAAAFILLSVLSVRPAPAEAVDSSDLDSLAKEIAVLVNEARAEEGLDPVYVLPVLTDSAMIRAEECAVLFDHKRPDGTRFSSLLDQDVTPYCYAAENIAAGSSKAEAAFSQWKNSERHWAAITNPDITHMGIGVAYVPDSRYKWYWAQIFIQTTSEDGLEGEYLPQRYEIVPKAVGDLNGDGVVDSFDYLVLTEYLEKKSAGEPVYLNELQIAAADCFKDGAVTYADAKVLQRYLLGEYKNLPYVF